MIEHRPAKPWTGRDDGPDPVHRRLHHCANERTLGLGPRVTVVGFASDEGVRRNQGRVGAADGPNSLRAALGGLAAHREFRLQDLGDIAPGADLEGGQAELGRVLAEARKTADLSVVLGGGHETAFASYLGLAPEMGHRRVGVLNLDAHFDLRTADQPTSGTPFLQMALAEEAEGRSLNYAVIGLSRAGNTRVLYETADALSVRYLHDTEAQSWAPQLEGFLDEWLASVDAVYMTIDLDVLPAATAPGVSAPAALGVPMAVIDRVCSRVAASGRLTHLDVVELNPSLDVDTQTARAGARLIHTVLGALPDLS